MTTRSTNIGRVGLSAALIALFVQLSPMGAARAASAPALRYQGQPSHFENKNIVTGARALRAVTAAPTKPAGPDANEIEFEVRDRTGAPPPADRDKVVYLTPMNGDEPQFVPLKDGHGEGSFATGDYVVSTQVMTPEKDGSTSATLVYMSRVSITGDASLVLDARQGRPVQMTVDRADAQVFSASVIVTQQINGERQPIEILTNEEGGDLYITPAGAEPGLAYGIQGRLTKGGVPSGSPYIYNLAATLDRVPTRPLRVRDADLAVVRTRYASEGGPACAGTHAGVETGVGVDVGLWAGIGALPAVRTEYFTPGFTWSNDEGVTTADCSFEWENTDVTARSDRFPAAGRYTRRWNGAPFGPAAGFLDVTHADETVLEIPMLSQRDAGSGTAPYAHMTGTSTLRDADGAVVASSEEPGWAWPWQRPAAGRYQLTVDAHRDAPWSDLATRQHVVWNFEVGREQRITLPAVRYDTSLGIDDRARPGSRQEFRVKVEGIEVPPGKVPSFWTSYDDGKTWRQVALRPAGNQWTASVHNPDSGYISLRTTLDGVVDQTAIRAYAIA